MKSKFTYVPPPPVVEHHSEHYEFQFAASERISIIAALQEGLDRIVERKRNGADTYPHVKVDSIREFLKALGVGPCR